ncbi:HECT-domain (ubiquitin-transferase) domain-containing protein [Babesia ovis]|uniref:HECT-domain (Ubiquitin-transferase) domain-containing protein n=1 Tax=Babesia ovis TaxID=5869 RepID=A0A9W5TBN6_BABOV|nr:HECT-domain (ubiquitin-transferase) domain-containing protein [Babesia ovis]
MIPRYHFTSGHLRRCVRHFGVSGSYGPSIYGIQQTQTNSRLIRLPEEKPPPQVDLYSRIHVLKWPGEIRALRSSYFFRPGQRTNTGYYHMLIRNKKDICLVSNVDKRLTQTRAIENCLYERTRGFAGQVLLHGRGVKAFFEPSFPHLMFRLGVGSNCLDATRICTMYAKHVKVDVDRTGMIVSVHGYNKMMVGNVIYRLFRLVEANPYTLKGGHIANYPIKRKVPKKR